MTAELIEDAGSHEPVDIFRLYCPEWNVVYTVPFDESQQDPVRACERHFQERYAGRVHDDDVRVSADIATVARLELKLPTLKGEFKFAQDAHDHAKAAGWEVYAVVERNTPADHDLRAYGVKKLR